MNGVNDVVVCVMYVVVFVVCVGVCVGVCVMSVMGVNVMVCI